MPPNSMATTSTMARMTMAKQQPVDDRQRDARAIEFLVIGVSRRAGEAAVADPEDSGTARNSPRYHQRLMPRFTRRWRPKYNRHQPAERTPPPESDVSHQLRPELCLLEAASQRRAADSRGMEKRSSRRENSAAARPASRLPRLMLVRHGFLLRRRVGIRRRCQRFLLLRARAFQTNPPLRPPVSTRVMPCVHTMSSRGFKPPSAAFTRRSANVTGPICSPSCVKNHASCGG